MNQPIQINAQQTEQIIEQLWLEKSNGNEAIVYAILDGARNKKIHPLLAASDARFSFLFEEKLDYGMTLAAPYIVRLEKQAIFTRKLIQQAWGNSWGIFAITHKPATLISVRRHCRENLHVQDEETKKKMFFRYYDPRVLRSMLPSFQGDKCKYMFGPITAYAIEDTTIDNIIIYRNQSSEGPLQINTVPCL